MATQKATSIDHMTPDEVRALVHELEIHKVELEIQNEQLTETQLTLESRRSAIAASMNRLRSAISRWTAKR